MYEHEELLDRLPWAVLAIDRDLGVVFANAATTRVLGRAADHAPGSPLPVAWGSFPVREFARGLFAAAAETEPPAFASLGDRTVSVIGLPANGADTAILLAGDVTERERRLEAERHFLENAAHELRTPLAAIVSVVEALNGGAKDVPEARDRFLSHLTEHSNRLVRLGTSLLALARVQSGAEEPRLRAVDLRALCEEVAASLHAAPAVSVAVDVPDDIAVIADPELLRLIVSNVANNAARHTHDGEIRFTARSRSEESELEVRDTGPGMTADDRASALVRFHRGSNADGQGFGLGLAIAAEAAEELNGSLRVEPAPDRGTIVRIALPGGKIVD
jgi:signal transduction histidine kinase